MKHNGSEIQRKNTLPNVYKPSLWSIYRPSIFIHNHYGSIATTACAIVQSSCQSSDTSIKNIVSLMKSQAAQMEQIQELFTAESNRLLNFSVECRCTSKERTHPCVERRKN